MIFYQNIYLVVFKGNIRNGMNVATMEIVLAGFAISRRTYYE